MGGLYNRGAYPGTYPVFWYLTLDGRKRAGAYPPTKCWRTPCGAYPHEVEMAFGAYPGAYLFSYFCDLLHPGEHLGTYPHEALIALSDAFKAFSTDEVAGWRNCWFAVPTFLFSCIRKYHVRLCCSKGAGAYLGAYPTWGRIVLERHKGVWWVRAGVAHTFSAYHVHLCASRMPEFHCHTHPRS